MGFEVEGLVDAGGLAGGFMVGGLLGGDAGPSCATAPAGPRPGPAPAAGVAGGPKYCSLKSEMTLCHRSLPVLASSETR